MKPFPYLTRRILLIALHDAIATGVAVVLSFYLRFGEDDFAGRLPQLLVIVPYFVAFSVVVCYVCDLTLTKWRFTSLPELLNIVKVATILSVTLLVLDYIFVAPNVLGAFFFGKTTIVIYWLLQIALLSGTRLAYRYYRTSRTRTRSLASNAAPVLLVGNAADAELLIRSIESGAVRQIWPIALLSPSPSDRGQMVRGIPVLGGTDDLTSVVNLLARRGKPVERIVMMPSALAAEIAPQLVREARGLALIVSRLPSLEDSYEQPRLTPVAVEDLLLRPTVKIDYGRLESLVKGKSIVVTGGGGSIGAEICNRIVAFGAARLMILENSEPALYAAMEALGARNRSVAIDGRIADIRDRERVIALLFEFKPDIVFHAAALKHVPILERDFGEGVKTNIFGTINVADASLAAGARAMVMISTDKAVEPVSMLGLTKRFAEMYCQARDNELARAAPSTPPMRLISVRFGNVLASNGSVVPKFKAQIEAGGPVTVTHPDMVRYFMTIREACDLVISSASHALGGGTHDVSVYVLNMGQPVRIADLAERLVRLSGLVPGEDIEIVYTGIRPGERLHELLFTAGEPTSKIGIEGITAAKPYEPSMPAVLGWIHALQEAENNQDYDRIRSILQGAIPEFRTENTTAAAGE